MLRKSHGNASSQELFDVNAKGVCYIATWSEIKQENYVYLRTNGRYEPCITLTYRIVKYGIQPKQPRC